MIANVALLPCGPSAMDAWAMAESVDLVKKATAVRPDLMAVAVITRKVTNTVIGAGARDALAMTGLRILNSELHYRVAYQEAPALGLGIAQHSPRDAAATEVRRLVDELLGESHGKTTDSNHSSQANASGSRDGEQVRLGL
jgi:chromosome partitioning protein